MTIKASQSSSLAATDDTTSPNIILLVSDEFKKLYPKADNCVKTIAVVFRPWISRLAA